MDLLFYIIAGAGVGLAVGLTGVGGVSLMTPILILYGIPEKVAIGTDLLYAALTKFGGAWSHKKRKNIRWRVVFLLSSGSIPASLATGALLKLFFNGHLDYSHILTHSLGIMLIATGFVIFFRKKVQQERSSHPDSDYNANSHKHTDKIIVFAGVVLGVLVTLSSVGAGAFCAALLFFLYPKMPALHVVGTDIAHAVPLTLIAGLGHFFLLDNIDFELLCGLLIGSLPAVHIGAKAGSKIPNSILQPVLATLLIIIGCKFLFF